MPKDGKYRILFLCTANLVRSPMSEYLLKHMAAQVGATNILTGSSGIFAVNGESSPEEVTIVMQENGIDVSQHQAQVLTQEQVDWADHILVMEDYHRRLILEGFDGARKKIQLLSEFAPPGTVPRDIDDPYGHLLEDYRRLYHQLKRCVSGLFAQIGNV